MMHRGEPCGSQKFWVVNWLRLVDAIDIDRSAVLSRGTSKQQVFTPHIVAERVPADAFAFRLREYQSRTIVRSALKKAFKKAGLTGFIFERCHGDR